MGVNPNLAMFAAERWIQLNPVSAKVCELNRMYSREIHFITTKTLWPIIKTDERFLLLVYLAYRPFPRLDTVVSLLG